jgi:N-acetyl-alpha-D-muramate 1-phosphate uridylyltransferase
MFPVAILAGGLATRLGAMTEKAPKALIEVWGEPFVCRQLDYIRHQGVTQVIMCTGHLGEQIEAVVKDGAAFDLKVRYSRDGSRLLGTGGALRRALPLLGEHFFVLYGDSYLPCDFRSVQNAFLKCGKPALLTVLRNEDRWDRSNVLFRDGCVVEYNKRARQPAMAHIDYGLSILSAAVLRHYSDGDAFDLADVYHALSLTNRLAGFEVSTRFYEIGSLQGLRETEAYFSERGAV